MPSITKGGLCPTCLLQQGIGSRIDSQLATEPGAATSAAAQGKVLSIDAVQKVFPNLEIIGLLGRGGMGVVYKARQPQLDRFVALKLLPAEAGRDPAFAERFSREAKALAWLNHPNIVGVYDFGQAGGHFYLMMEFVDGMTLRQLEHSRKLAPEEALAIAPRICEALQYAHDEGVVHRDIKPGNILVDKKGRVKIADFGLAKLLGHESPDFSLTGEHAVMGTPHYMAPEQMTSSKTVDHRADIYSLGVVVYEMLTGELPVGRFAAPSKKVRIDVRLDEVVLKALESDPELRFQRVSDVKSELDTISGHLQALPPHVRAMFGFEYKSTRQIWGMPLLHVAHGFDPVTGKNRSARGFVAIGGRATGVIAFGGMATGIVAFGGIARGVFALGGISLGFFAMGGLALALLFGHGGMALGGIVTGGFAAGIIAQGGAAFSLIPVHGLDANAAAQALVQLTARIPLPVFLILSNLAWMVPVFTTIWARRQLARGKTA